VSTVLVTGSSGSIGQAIVERLQFDGLGVIGLDCEPPPENVPDVGFVHGDVAEHGTVVAATAAARDVGGLWAVVHCAGRYPLLAPEDYSAEAWQEVNDVNVGAAFRLVRALSGLIVPGGRVAMIASGAAHIGSHDVGYAVSKAGLLGLVRALALALADREILVNAVTPGIIQSSMSARMTDERRHQHVSSTLLGRVGRPPEVAAAVAFLLDPRNSYMTGASIDVNGGLYFR
jgi:3-oxoacyl-[acyl-carrier protein] reductase